MNPWRNRPIALVGRVGAARRPACGDALPTSCAWPILVASPIRPTGLSGWSTGLVRTPPEARRDVSGRPGVSHRMSLRDST